MQCAFAAAALRPSPVWRTYRLQTGGSAPAVLAMTASVAIVRASRIACVAYAGPAAPPASPLIPTPPPTVRDFGADIAQAKDWQRRGMSNRALALLSADHRLDPTNRDVIVALANTASFTGD